MNPSILKTWTIAVSLLSASLCGAHAEAVPIKADHAWTPRQSVDLRYFVADPSGREAGSVAKGSDAVVPSPDGKYFSFINHHGDLESDCNDYELQVFSSERVRNAVARAGERRQTSANPVAAVTFNGCSSGRHAITEARWESDGSGILSRAIDERGITQLYRLDVGTGQLQQLTDGENDVSSFKFVHGGLIFETRNHEFFTRALGGYVRTLFGDFTGDAWLSPDGRKAVMLRRGDSQREEFVLVDLVQGYAIPIADSAEKPLQVAVGQSNSRVPAGALWSADGEHLVLVNATFPFAEPGETPFDEPPGLVMDYNVNTGHFQLLEPVSTRFSASSAVAEPILATSASWVGAGNDLLVTHAKAGKPVDGAVYTLSGGVWDQRSVKASWRADKPNAFTSGLTVALRQGSNIPPTVVASYGSREMSLLPPDPVLQGVWRTPAFVFTWLDHEGKIREGGLFLPPNFRYGEPVPIVIQASQRIVMCLRSNAYGLAAER